MNPELEALQAEWATRAAAIRSEQEGWFRCSVRAGAPVQSLNVPWLDWLDGERRRGQDRWVLGLPLVALRKLERLAFEPGSPAAVGDHRHDLVRIARRLHAAVNLLENQGHGGRYLSPLHNDVNAQAEHEAACAALRAIAVAYGELEGGY